MDLQNELFARVVNNVIKPFVAFVKSYILEGLLNLRLIEKVHSMDVTFLFRMPKLKIETAPIYI